MVLVDTPVWSLALRRRAGDLSSPELRLTRRLQELVREGRVQLLGTTRQEVLSGIREEKQFQRIRGHLRAFQDVMLTTDDYEEAARMSKRCRRSGVASSAADMLICAVSGRRRWQILSADGDFAHYSRVPGLRLLPLSSAIKRPSARLQLTRSLYCLQASFPKQLKM
jgi:predicted nucleic acid-binding protein